MEEDEHSAALTHCTHSQTVATAEEAALAVLTLPVRSRWCEKCRRYHLEIVDTTDDN